MNWKWGVLFRWGSAWVGVHYSGHNQRWCINVVPCVTLWIARPGGKVPSGPDYEPKPCPQTPFCCKGYAGGCVCDGRI